MSRSLQSLLKAIDTAATHDAEQTAISDELAKLRSATKECTDSDRPRVVIKLVYLDTLGHDVSWGDMEVVKLMAHDRPSHKRIGYLAANHLFNEQNERLVLLIATVHKDLSSPNAEVQRLALTAIANISSPEMGETMIPEVIRLASSSNRSVQKCAGMAAVRICRKNPALSDHFRGIVITLLNHPIHSVVTAGIHLSCLMLKRDPSASALWSHMLPPFRKLLKAFFESRGTQEYKYGGFHDPFLQVRVMQWLAAMRTPSDPLDDVLAAIVTGVDIHRGCGRSLLLQAVDTIGHVAKQQSLRTLAYNQVGRLFTYRQPNLLYSGLSTFARMLYSEHVLLDRASAEQHVLQRYRMDVVRCLDHRDPSIRRRALDVVAALVDETNVEILVPEILEYLKGATGDFRSELVSKVFIAIQKFAPTVTWNFDTVLTLMSGSGDSVGQDVITAFCRLIAHHVELRPHALERLSDVIAASIDGQPLLQVAAWTIGEFEDERADSLEILGVLLAMPQTKVATKAYLLTAVAKLAVRLGEIEEGSAILERYANDNHIEIQQRAGELLRVFDHADLRDAILAPVEVGEEAQEVPETEQDEEPLADFDEDVHPHHLLLGKINPPSPQSSMSPPRPLPDIVPPEGSLEALRTLDYVVYFEIQKNAHNANQLAIRASIFNCGEVALTHFRMQFGVPQGWAILVHPPSSFVLEVRGAGPIQQVMILENRGVNPLAMMTQTSYVFRAEPKKETGWVSPIFD